MGVVEAALWGLAGGGAVGVLSLMTAITNYGFGWPWRAGEAGPRLFVLAGGLLLGALVAAASHTQMSGPWPAFVIGAGAPATVKGLLGGVQVTPRPQSPTAPPPPEEPQPIQARTPEGDVSESAP
jgi:hypothetical protein